MPQMMLPIYLSRRLSLSSGGRKSSPAVRVATAAVALSVAVMIISIAVVIGFKREITSRVTGFNSDITLTALVNAYSSAKGDVSAPSPADSDPIVTLTPSLRATLEELPFVRDVSLQINIPAIFKTKDDFKGVYLKALSGEDVRRFVGNALEEGRMLDNDSSVMVSRRVADKLHLKVGDLLPTYFMSDRLQVRRLRVAGIYNSHFDDYDENYAFAALAPIQQLGGLSASQGTAISVAVDDFANVDLYTAHVQQTIMEALQSGLIYRPLRVSNAQASGAAYFHWLSMLDMNVWVVLVLMTVVACVTLVSGMLIIMVDKVRFIALMSALGAPRKLLSRVFILLAVRVAAVGLLIGDIVGIGIILLQKYTAFAPLDPDSYYIDFVPVALNPYAIVLLNIAVIFVAWLMLILPSRYVGKVSPARILSRE